MTFDGDRDGLDDEALHLVAIGDGGEVIGTCRLLIEPGGTARFGRLCVRASARGTGVGARAARRGRARGAGGAARAGSACTRRPTRSRCTVARASGPTASAFDEEGIEHVGMEKDL